MGMEAEHALSTQGLCAVIGTGKRARPVLQEIDLALPAGRWTSIVGPNGAGKSTLLRALAGLHRVQGQIRLWGRPLAAWPPRERARTLAWLGQGGAAEGGAEDLSVLDVALLGRLPHQGWLSEPSADDWAAVERALRQTGAWEYRERRLGALSGGERQRVLLARLLAVEARVLLMDEPLANLDAPHQADWVALVRELAAQGCAVVSVLHELSLALLADHLVVLHEGRVRYAGAPTTDGARDALSDVFGHRLAFHEWDGHWVALPR